MYHSKITLNVGIYAMEEENRKADPFYVKDCALIAIATGKKVQNLVQLRDSLQTIDSASIYYHFWGGLLRPRFDDPEYHNDFAIWAAHGLHDKILAERLAIIDPTDFENMEDLRSELLEVIEQRLDAIDFPLWARRDQQFEFIQSKIVIFDTGQKAFQPEEFLKILPGTSVGSIFYHFIDARRRNPEGVDDFRNWINGFGDEYTSLVQRISELDPYFSPLSKLRAHLANIFTTYFE